jgi:hypothetical protein
MNLQFLILNNFAIGLVVLKNLELNWVNLNCVKTLNNFTLFMVEKDTLIILV